MTPANNPDTARVLAPADLADAREMMRGIDAPAMSLAATARVLGVLAADLDLALWAGIGRRA